MKNKTLFNISFIFLLLGSSLMAQNDFWTKIGIDEDSKANTMFINTDGDIYVGSGDMEANGALYFSDDDGDSWSEIYEEGGPGISAMLVIDDNTILIGTGSGINGAIKLTTNGGTSWEKVYDLGITELVTSFVETSAGIFASSGVYNGTSGKIIFSDDNGASWSVLTSSLGAVLAMKSKSNGDLFAGNHYGDLYKSVDDGNSWSSIRTGTNRDIGSVTLNSLGDIYIGVEYEGIYRTTNEGSTWIQMNNGLGNKQVSVILLVNDTLFFAGTPQDGVFRSVNSGYGWSNVGNNALRIYNNYLYCGVGNGIYKSLREATDIPAPPSPPKNLSVTDGPGIVTLNWDESDSANADVFYNIYRRTSETEFSLHRSDINSTITEYVDSVRNDVQYYYYMTSLDIMKALESDSTEHVAGMSILHDPVPPDKPQNLTATAGDEKVELRWNAVDAAPVTYSIFRSTTSNEYGNALVEELTSTTYTDNSVSNETRYYYIVKARNDTSDLYSISSNEVNALPVKPPPEAPTNLQASTDMPNIVIWWDESSSDDVTAYRIYRSKSQGIDYQLIGTEAAPSNTFTDINPGRDTTFYYVVAAWDDIHESEKTNEVSAMVESMVLKLYVNPSSRYTADRFDELHYEITTTDNRGNLIDTDIEINNGIDGSVVNDVTVDGEFDYSYEIPGDQDFSDYSITFTVTKEDYESAMVVRYVRITPIPRSTNDWAYVYTEDDDPMLIFAMADTNDKWYSTGDPGKISNDGYDIVINGYLLFNGSFTVDTINKVIVSDGKWYVNSPIEPPNEYVLLDGEVGATYNSNTLSLNHDEDNLQGVSTVFGTKLYPDIVGFLGGLYASGISIKGYFYLDGVKGDCDNPDDEIYFKDFIFDESGVNVSQLELPSLRPDPTACFENLQCTYDKQMDKLILYGDFSIPWFLVKGSADITQGQLDIIHLSSNMGQASGIGHTGMSILNVSGEVSGITNPPMEMTLDGMVISSLQDYFQFDIGGEVNFPQIVEFDASEARIIQEPTFNNWQITGPMAGEMNVTSFVDLSGDVQAGTLDGGLYVLDGAGNFRYQWDPDEMLRGNITGSVTLTDFPDEFPWDAIGILWEGDFPVQLHDANVFVHERKVKGNLDFGGLIGILNFTLDLDKVYGQEGFLTIGSGAQNLNGIVRKDEFKKDKMQTYDPNQFEGQSLPIMVMKRDKIQAITNNDTLNLTGGMDKVFIRIMSDTQVPGSSLIDPSGNKHDSDDETPKDSNVVFKKSANGKKGYWIIKDDFEEGQWISVTDPDESKPEDYRDIFATFEKRDIQLLVSKEQNTVTANWNATGVQEGPYLEFYLALDTNDMNGLYIGEADEKDGEFGFEMTDELPECLYYLYVLRYEGDKIDRYYSAQELINNKGNLMAPDITSSVYYGSTKKLVVSWVDANPVENIQGYLIRLTYNDETEEIVARPYAGETGAEIDIDIDTEVNDVLTVAMAAYTGDGFQSCWSADEGVTVDVKDYPLAGFENENDRISVFPNPLKDNTNIRFKVFGNHNVRIEVYDLLGNEVAVLTNKMYGEGIYDINLDTKNFVWGTYYIKYCAGDVTVTKLMVIAK